MTDDQLAKLEEVLNVLLSGHRNDLIIEQAKKILTIDPQNGFASRAIVLAYNNSQQYEQMFESCQLALQYWPNDPWLHNSLYYYYLEKGGNDYLNAKREVETAIKLDPTNSSYYRNLAEIYLINWEPDKAERYLRKAVELSPEDAEYRSRLALALLRQKKKDESLKFAKEALSEEPDNEHVLDTVGMIYILSGELDKAEEFFREALRRHPTRDYFKKHMDWINREKSDKNFRERQKNTYTPLYLRQKGTKRFFDEDSMVNQ